MKLAVTLEDVRKSDHKTIYYSANTIWWTHDPEDLCNPSDEYLNKMTSLFGEEAVKAFKENPLPLDAFNSPLYITEEKEAWTDASRIESFDVYGERKEDRVEVFMWSHAKNMKLVMEELIKFEKIDSTVITKFKTFNKFLRETLKTEV